MNDQIKIVELEANGERFSSPNDEAAFFEWLKKIPCVHSFGECN